MSLLINHGAIGRAKLVSLIGLGTVFVSSASTITYSIPYPIGIQNKDLLLLAIYNRTSGVTPNTPAGWFQLSMDTDPAPFTRLTIYSKIADGSEAGSLTVNTVGSSNLKIARIFNFRGQLDSPFSFFQSSGLNTGSASIAHTPITSIKGAVCLSFIGRATNEVLPAYTGANGTWSIISQTPSALGNTGNLVVQLSTLAESITLSGGTMPFGPVYIARSFALIPK